MIHLFCGYDEREAIGFAVFAHSVIARASRPVALIPLSSMGLPTGTNAFTLSRFMVANLMGYRGHAIFADACDMLCLGDIAELDRLFDDRFAVQVVKHADYQTRHPRKYVGTGMEAENRDYPRKNHASLMIVNCAHPVWRGIAAETLRDTPPLPWLQFAFVPDAEIGALPAEWNVLVDEGQDRRGAKILHWTAGIPAFEHYRNAPCFERWYREHTELEV